MERKTFIHTFVMVSGTVMLAGPELLAKHRNKETMKIHMIYNNTGKHEGLKNAWGLAAWVEADSEITLFDTGGDPDTLLGNMEYLSLNPKQIARIVISHNHWDHKGGVHAVLDRIGRKTDLFVVKADEEEYRQAYPSAKVTGILEGRQIQGSIWSTGMLTGSHRDGELNEQSLILVQENSIAVLTGCSHPGIVTIVEQAADLHPGKKIAFVGGGFHLMRKQKKTVLDISGRLKELGVQQIAASHCTGNQAIDIFRKEWGNRFYDLNLGDTYTT
jgi:7,8-dihydropterin-6-yl-methyl-4-(beta-D-ribofuranosyl)aminobenzene 5'-phosphate synthase